MANVIAATRKVDKLVCTNCGHEWVPNSERPKKCPKCVNTLDWDGFEDARDTDPGESNLSLATELTQPDHIVNGHDITEPWDSFSDPERTEIAEGINKHEEVEKWIEFRHDGEDPYPLRGVPAEEVSEDDDPDDLPPGEQWKLFYDDPEERHAEAGDEAPIVEDDGEWADEIEDSAELNEPEEEPDDQEEADEGGYYRQ